MTAKGMTAGNGVAEALGRLASLVGAVVLTVGSLAAEVRIVIDKAMPPPPWALAERELLEANARGAEAFFHRYLDDRGYLLCVERWGGNDGPDDAMETFNNWTLAYALGAPESLLTLYQRAWEGHILQYTEVRAAGIEMAEDGMYWREFVTAFDWEHNGEGLAAFHFYGLGKPDDPMYRRRVRRFTSFYNGEDEFARNYDSEHKIIRSLHNGSRGPKLSPASEEDWGGLAVEGRPERQERYSTAANIRGDHPLNLCSATLGTNAYMLTHEPKYRNWVLEYVSAWRDRILENDGNIPTNIGLDGTIGGEWDGKWYGGTFGWNFWPQSASRNYYIRGPRVALGQALMLTGDQGFVEPLRRQIDNLYAAKKMENGRILLPNKHGDNGWYGYRRGEHFDVQRDIYLWSMRPADMDRIKNDPWISYLDGRNSGYPLKALQAEIARVRGRVKGLREDQSTPDSRGSDSAQRFNPVATTALVNLTLGGNSPGSAGNVLHSRLRYFDPDQRRAGLPEDVAALVSKITPAGVVVTLVNTSQTAARRVTVQAGAYGEHHFQQVDQDGQPVPVDDTHIEVLIEAGAGATLTLAIERYRHPPTLAFPWNRK